MNRFKIFTILTVIGILLLIMGCSNDKTTSSTPDQAESSSKDGKILLKVVHDVTEDHIKGVGADLFKELVEERLGDKVEVEVYPNSTLFDVEEGTEALQAGNVHVVISASSKLVGFDPAYQLYDVPFLFNTIESFYNFDNGEDGQNLRGKIENFDLKILGTWAGSFKQITNSKHPITKPEDMKGLKLRVMAGGLLEDQYTQLGAGATVIPFSDLYMSLQQGMIDGQENSFLEIATAKIFEVQDYMTITNHAPTTYPILTNKNFWENELPEDVRNELEAILEEVNEGVAAKAKEVEQEALDTIKNDGDMEIYELSDDELAAFRDAMQPLYEKYSEVIGEDLINKALESQ
ncbi:DctP family TRAP transporter solute-binding subunit [Pseudogracilibacillus sp. SE30717A]|uniref:DctP family TRAP transporter solute-binding subunit n=1 Tax=Pseudogracilibacillus sp. SE30717A TaxID=3098293 RepID=UPI00300E6C65